MNNVKSSFKLYDETIKYRHTDPPWFWTAVFTSSIFLHLFVFWLLRSYDQFLPWIPRSNQDYIAIDLIDIQPSVESQESQPTTVKPKVSSSSQKSVTASSPKTTLTTPENPDDQVISSDLNLSQQGESENTEVNNQPLEPTPTPTPTPTFTPQVQFTPKPTPTQTIPFNDLPWNRRQEIKLGKGTLLPNDIPSESPTPEPEPETASTPTPETTPTPTPETTSTPTPETTPTPTSEETTTPKAGGLLANIAPILRDEIEQLRQDGKLRVDGLPDVLAEYQGSPNKELELNFLASDSGLKPANILASLIIDKNGNFQQAVIINLEPAALRSEKSIYEQALNEIFQQESFVGAYNQDGSKPELSNLYVRIKIEPINFQ
ncbi:hypothetical protein [Sphaerospermopsis sp. LEGE 08334]|uniref:hypothetical protein n=1 Tax=Sphaerospermopsis sp. LEGE 08334 TaxID=1828651 RepID=UPI001882C323|nr:hypothetical protein [Sphaerospermopsis sp. LEGE 08334]MBE9057236.1 hypothetical protein [Sphaerospermopsis sp. LEGE 08334]